LLLGLPGTQDTIAQDGKPVDVVWVYRGKQTRTATEGLFAPFGLMPPERVRQTSVNVAHPLDKADKKKGTCIEYVFKLKKADDWLGSYHLLKNGTAWGTMKGIDVAKRLGLKPTDQVVLRFRARGEGVVSFKIGGVETGPYPSSMVPAREVKDSPTTLSSSFREYLIGPFPASEVTNLIDPFCVVTSALDNPGRKTVRVFVTDIRLEPYRPDGLRKGLPAGWRNRLNETLLIAYTPSGFDPTARPMKRSTAEEIRADLAAIRALADKMGLRGERAGIITYGCSEGLEAIPELARDAKLSVLLGIFNPRNKQEVTNAERLLRQPGLEGTILGCCVGNEAVTFRRANLADIQIVVKRLRNVREVPLTTTEIVQAYGKEGIFDFDFTLFNAHALFANIVAPEPAARWAVARIHDVLRVAPPGHLILVKEVGWAAGPKPFDDKQQAEFWKAVLGDPVARQVNICIFDGLANVPWKTELVTLPGGAKVNVGPHWPVLFGAERKPKPFAAELLQLWKQSRSR